MIPVCRAETTRRLDRAVIEGLGVPGRVLMEIAGRGAAWAIHQRWPSSAVTVLCGPGNNGGDGYVIARWLHLWGHRVALWALDAKTDDAKANRALCEGMGIPFRADCAGDLVVDALLGTGQRSAPRGVMADMLAAAARVPVRVAVDMPTGVTADTGQDLGGALHADLTITFGRLKPGLLSAPGCFLAGEVETIDIGLDLARLVDPALASPDAWLIEEADVRAWLPTDPPASAKWDRGHVAIRAGGGAAVLASHGAFRARPGLVTLLAPRAEWPRLKGLWPEVILAEPAALDPRRHDALVVGPGLGLEAAEEVLRLWREWPRPLVADGDALTVLSRQERVAKPGGPRVITPHSAEAARLLGCSRAEVDADRLAALDALRAWGTPVLKGPHTLVGADQPWFNPSGSVRLATAGSGDVLAGMTGALLAKGLDPPKAAAAASFLHGLAGERMPVDGTASDLLAALRTVVAG